MSKSTTHSRRQRNPHTHDEQPDKTAFFSKASKEDTHQNRGQPFFQTKLAVGPANDQYEQEADHTAQAVVNNKNTAPVLQNQKISSVQRLATPVEDEKLGTNDARMAKDKEIQEKPIQRTTTDPEKEKIQQNKNQEDLKEETSTIQRSSSEASYENQTSDVQSNTTQRCDGWEGDPQSFSIRAAQNFCIDAFNVSVSTPDSVTCSASSCVVNYSSGGFNIKITVDLSGLPGIVSVSGTAAPFILRAKICSYRYSCDDTGSISFTRIGCRLI